MNWINCFYIIGIVILVIFIIFQTIQIKKLLKINDGLINIIENNKRQKPLQF
jgi:tellurite resistance protein TehA-like permease